MKPGNMTGADLLVNQLVSVGVKTIFAITGAGNLAVIDAVKRSGKIQLIYSHHEQAAVMEAQGYSRANNSLGVALVTTGGGTSNVSTGVLSAYLDSVPVLLISGNESSFHCANPHNLRAYGVQGFDSVSMLKTMTKYSVRVNSVSEIQSKLNRALSTATEGRQGPVHIDFPMDLQRAQATDQVDDTPQRVEVQGSSEIEPFLQSLTSALRDAEKPLIYIGNGCRDFASQEALRKVLSQCQIPFILSWSAIDLFPQSDLLNIGRVGIYGDRAANILLQQADLLICVGTRLAIPQIGYDRNDFARKANKFVVDIDPTELSKFEELGWNLANLSAESFFFEFSRILEDTPRTFGNWESWKSRIQEVWDALPRINQLGNLNVDSTGYIHSGLVLEKLNELFPDNAVVVTDVGAALLNGHYLFETKGTQRLFTSQGLGEMGFGLPGAIGAYFANENKPIICLNTDGAIMFNLQELQVVKEHSIPLKLFVFNNLGYTMIKVSQQNLFENRIEGSSVDTGLSFPAFPNLAELFGFEYLRVDSLDNTTALEQKLQSSKSVLFEVVMDPAQKYLPRLSTAVLPSGTLVSPPLEDLDPQIPIETLERLLGYKPHENSYTLRGMENNE